LLRRSDGTEWILYELHIVKRIGRAARAQAADQLDQAVAPGAEHPAVAAQPSGRRAPAPQRRRPRLPPPDLPLRAAEPDRPAAARLTPPAPADGYPRPPGRRRLGGG